MCDDASYLQQPYDLEGYQNQGIQQILAQFTNNEEIFKFQQEYFGKSREKIDPHLKTPKLSQFSNPIYPKAAPTKRSLANIDSEIIMPSKK